jgi:3-oxoadipate enol-lactonase
MTSTANASRFVTANDLEIYVEQVGHGPDVLLIGGLGDTVESWQFQLDGLAGRYRLTAFENRGAGRTPMPDGIMIEICPEKAFVTTRSSRSSPARACPGCAGT